MKASSLNFAALDLGASNGRTVLGRLHRGQLDIEVIHRFEHTARRADGHLRWDWPRICAGVDRGLASLAEALGRETIASLSCDAWAQDFGLIDTDGRLVYSPVSYRDARSARFPEGFFDRLDPQELMTRVGSGCLPIVTLCQLCAMAREEPEELARASRFLHVADLVHHRLCGEAATDWTLATVSQLRNLQTGLWDKELLERMSVPTHILPRLQEAPAVLGAVLPERAPHPKLAGVPVVTVANHDTAAASLAAAPLDRETILLSVGTYAMLGCTLDHPAVPDDAADRGYGLAGMGDRRWLLFYPVQGLWAIQECCRQWRKDGRAVGYEELVHRAGSATIDSVVPLSHPRFVAPGNMPDEIREACRERNLREPCHRGEVARVVLNSLIRQYGDIISELSAMTGQRFQCIHLVSGGSQNAHLCQGLADAVGVRVLAGPVEAAAIGNILLQARLYGEMDDCAEIGRLLDRSFGRRSYEPRR